MYHVVVNDMLQLLILFHTSFFFYIDTSIGGTYALTFHTYIADICLSSEQNIYQTD